MNAGLGAFLLLVAAAVVALFSASGDVPGPLLAVQVTLVALASAFGVLAGFETRITDRVAWYRLSGLGNVFLGASLPLGLPERTLTLALAVLGGGALAAMGIDMLLFEGRHAYGEPLRE